MVNHRHGKRSAYRQSRGDYIAGSVFTVFLVRSSHLVPRGGTELIPFPRASITHSSVDHFSANRAWAPTAVLPGNGYGQRMPSQATRKPDLFHQGPRTQPRDRERGLPVWRMFPG